MDAAPKKMTRLRNHLIEVGYLFPSQPDTIYLTKDGSGSKYQYPNAEMVEREGWKEPDDQT